MSKVAKGKVRLRVVGIFYDEDLSFTDIKGAKSIKDLLDLAVAQAQMVDDKAKKKISRFSYTSTITNKLNAKGDVEACNSLFGFTHYIEKMIEPSLGSKVRLPGYYKLFESTSVERDSVTVHAWQYYVIRQSEAESNFWTDKGSNPEVSPAVTFGKPGAAGFVPFDKLILKDGDEVVWRNVAIVRNPQTEPIY